MTASIRPAGCGDGTVRRVANVRLRGPGGPLPGRVYWPTTRAGTARLLVAFGLTDADCRALCTGSGLIVLATDAADLADATAALGWAADHAHELTAVTGGLLVTGDGIGAALAASVTAGAHEAGWPPVTHREVLRTGESSPALSNSAAPIRRIGEDPDIRTATDPELRQPRRFE